MSESKKTSKLTKLVPHIPLLRKVLRREKKMTKNSLNCFRANDSEQDHDHNVQSNEFYIYFNRVLKAIRNQGVKDMILQRIRNGDAYDIHIYNDMGSGSSELMRLMDRDLVNIFDDELNWRRADKNVDLDRYVDIYGSIVRHILTQGDRVSISSLSTAYDAWTSVAQAKLQRAYEMETGIDLPKNWNPFKRVQLRFPDPIDLNVKRATKSKNANVSTSRVSTNDTAVLSPMSSDSIVCVGYVDDNNQCMVDGRFPAVTPPDYFGDNFLRRCSLIRKREMNGSKFLYFLVPDLISVVNCSFYWGKIDRCDAEKLLEDKSDGSFLLRDSTQNDYVFSVSFRKYGRSLHARIEQWNHMFSFDSHDPTFFASDTICGLIEHYNDINHVYFEPSLLTPVHRNNPFSLKNLSRAVIATHTTYSAIELLQLPTSLKNYLKEYHYKQKVRVNHQP